MINLNDLSNEDFVIERLSEFFDLTSFHSKKGFGLEHYLRESALKDEHNGLSRTYLIVSRNTNMIVAYFSLRTGLITVKRGFLKGFDTYTGIELANFAVNDSYREAQKDNVIPQLGAYIFSEFILPLTEFISQYVGAAYLYIYSLPSNRLMAHYEKMGFSRLSGKASRFVYRHVKPAYDEGCVFMYQKIT